MATSSQHQRRHLSTWVKYRSSYRSSAMTTAMPKQIRALLAGAALLLGLLPRVAAAQELICCSQLVRFGGDWFGALRECGQQLEQAKPEQVRSVCQQLRRSACEEVAPYCQPCRGDEAKKRSPGSDSLAPGHPVYDGLVDGARGAGIAGFGPEHLAVQERDDWVFWQIRLDTGGCPLPGGDCIRWAGENGYLPEGKQEGSKLLVLGGVQIAGNALRVNGRYVSVETGVIQGSATSPTVTGTDRAAVAQAMTEMLRKLGMRCHKARGMEY